MTLLRDLEKHNQRYLDKEVTLKRFIYYMRGLLSCRWVEQNSCHPPVNVDELIDVTITDNENVREKAHRLLVFRLMSFRI
jgi:predicted nucleotidyltransferase